MILAGSDFSQFGVSWRPALLRNPSGWAHQFLGEEIREHHSSRMSNPRGQELLLLVSKEAVAMAAGCVSTHPTGCGRLRRALTKACGFLPQAHLSVCDYLYPYIH